MRLSETTSITAEDITITARLFSRAARPPDLIGEASAFHALSEALLFDPSSAIQQFIDMALDLCPNADSAGVSELEHLEDGTSQFRWTALSGAMAPYIGGVASRTHSPCGLCLDAHHSILVTRPARFFDFIGDLEIPVVEGLCVPLYDTHKAPLGTIWLVSHREGEGFDATDARIVEQLAVLLVLGIKLRKADAGAALLGSTPRMDDAANLIERIARERDQAAFTALFSIYAGKIKGLMVKRGLDSGQAEACAQETLLTVWRTAGQFDPRRSSAAAWIFTIARNHHIEFVRHENHPNAGLVSVTVKSRIELAAARLRAILYGRR